MVAPSDSPSRPIPELDVVGLRRLFHAHPETAFTELFTAATILDELRRLGYAVSAGPGVIDLSDTNGLPSDAEQAAAVERAIAWGATETSVAELAGGHTGVVAELAGTRAGRTVAFRFDIDALPLAESRDAAHFPAANGFAGSHGRMHACGHDGHAAIGLALARRLADRDFPGTVRLVFQPAEEGGRGAAAMLARDVLAGVDQLYGMHLGLELPVGTIAAGTTGFFANVKLRAAFTGVQAHAAASPEHGRHAVLAAATATLGLHALPRFAAADTRVNVGALHGGSTANIIPGHAEMLAELRSTSGNVCDELRVLADRVLHGAATTHGVEVDVQAMGAATTAPCDADPVARVTAAARRVPQVTEVLPEHPLGASEDCTWLMRAVQARGGEATYFLVGGGNAAPHHSPEFDVDERALPIAVRVLDIVARGTDSGSTSG